MKRAALALFLALGIAGCASVPAIIQIAGYVLSGMEVAISAVETFAEANVSDAATKAKILNDIAQAKAAEATFQALVNGGAALNSKDVTQALGDFEVAWVDLEGLLKSFGVMTAAPSSRVGLAPVSGRLVLPDADAMMPGGADLAGIHDRAASVRAARAQARRSLDPADGFAGLAAR